MAKITEDKRKKIKKNDNFSIRKLIYNDKYLIIFSIVAAIVIWVITSINLSPVTTKTITVPVNVDFSTSVAGKLGLKCYGDETINVDVTVNCKKYLAKDITAEDLAVELQLNTVTAKGVYDVPIKVDNKSNTDFSIQDYSPASYSAYFDYESEKKMNIQVEYEEDDFIKEGYIKGEPMLSENTAIVKGPKSYVSKVKSLVAVVNIEDELHETQTINIDPKPLDENNRLVSLITIDTGSSNPTLTIPVLKETNLDVAISFTNIPENLSNDDIYISYSRTNVKVGVLEDTELTEANIGDIDFSKLKVGRNEFTFQVSNLDSFVVLEDIREINVTVTVPESFSQKQLKIVSKDITVSNVPSGYKATVVGISKDSINADYVTIVGKTAYINTEKHSVGMVADLSALDEEITTRAYDVPITTTLDGTKSCWVYGDYIARVVITKK